MGACVSAPLADEPGAPAHGGARGGGARGEQDAAPCPALSSASALRMRLCPHDDQQSALASYDEGGTSGRSQGSRVLDKMVTRLRSSGRLALTAAFLEKVHTLQDALAMVHDNPILGLQEASELLAASLGADLVAIYVTPRGDPLTSVLIAAHGAGAEVLQRAIVLRGGPTLGQRLGWPVGLHIPEVAGSPDAFELAAQLTQGPDALRSLVQVPIGGVGHPLGTLVVGKGVPQQYDRNWWQVRLQVSCTGLVPHLRHAQVEQMAGLLKAMDATQDPVALISVLLRAASRFLNKACSLRASTRLALLQPQALGEALLFEAPYAAPVDGGANGGDVVTPSDATDDVVASVLPLHNTLLASAVKQQQARFISDCGAYMKSCPSPARDVFTGLSDLVASVVVIPLITPGPPPPAAGGAGAAPGLAPGGSALGGLYVAAGTPVEFVNISEVLLGFVHGVTAMLHSKLAGRAELLSSMITQIPAEPASEAATSGGLGPPRQLGDSARLPSEGSDISKLGPDGAAAANGGGGGGGGGSASGGEAEGGGSVGTSGGGGSTQKLPPAAAAAAPSLRLAKAPAGRPTDSMLQILQQDIRSRGRRSLCCARGPELVAGECLGRGGYGVAYKAWWHKVPVAAKVMPVHGGEREAMQAATEMAVLSSVQHPNVVAVFACLTDMVELPADEESGPRNSSNASAGSGGRSGAGAGRLRFRRLSPGASGAAGVPIYNIVVMEFCDRGTLRDAIKGGLFHQKMADGAIGVDLASVVEVLLDVALAVQYLHSMQLVHGDIKLENVLLKSDPSRRLGVTPKLADFGLTKILNEADHTVNLDGAGTVTHLAPEMFKAGSRVTKAVDSYAFGIFMWEMYTGRRAYAGLTAAAVRERVCRGELRPKFPTGAPAAFAALAEACWAQDPKKRPGFCQIAEQLEAAADHLGGATRGGAVGQAA